MPRIYKRNCNQCKKFYKNDSEKFCSRRCFGKSHKGINNPNFKHGKRCLPRTCPMCKRARVYRGINCSRKCDKKYKKGKHFSVKTEFKVGQRSPRYKGPVERFCKTCKVRFFISRSWANEGNRGYFHSKDCFYQWIEGKRFSPKTEFKKSKSTFVKYQSLRTKLMSRQKYKRWRRCVIRRDKNICQKCKNFTSVFHVDHIKPFSYFIYKYKIKTVSQAEKCRPLWRINNGRVLCVICHRKTDTYGNNRLIRSFPRNKDRIKIS